MTGQRLLAAALTVGLFALVILGFGALGRVFGVGGWGYLVGVGFCLVMVVAGLRARTTDTGDSRR